MSKYGIEIEFVSNNYYKVLEILNSFGCIVTFDGRYGNSNELILKPEATVKGCELNIPPNFNRLEELCEALKPYVQFTERCAMHIHVDSEGIDLDKLNNYYIEHENQIISRAGNRYVDLNYSNSKVLTCRRKNMNIALSNMKHGTVEHRIYKATFNYNDVMFAVEQTLSIIEESQK